MKLGKEALQIAVNYYKIDNPIVAEQYYKFAVLFKKISPAEVYVALLKSIQISHYLESRNLLSKCFYLLLEIETNQNKQLVISNALKRLQTAN